MAEASADESEKAQRDRIRRALLKCLKPIQAQEDSYLGCLLVLGAYPAAVLFIRLYLEMSLLASLGWGVLAWIGPLAVFGLYIESAERRAKGRGYEMFEMTYAPGSQRRTVALTILRQMARDEAHSHSKSASLLLTELGEDLLTEPPPEMQLKEQLEDAIVKPEVVHAPIEWKDPPREVPRNEPSRSRRRYEHIPLEPEDPDDSERKH